MVIGVLVTALLFMQGAAVPAIDAQDPDKLTQLMRASARGDVSLVNSLIEKGANPNVRNTDFGLTVLMFASFFGHMNVVQALLAKSADTAAQDAMESKTIDWASLGDHHAIAKVLADKGAKLNFLVSIGSMPQWLMDKAAARQP